MLEKVLERVEEVKSILESKGFPKIDIHVEIAGLKAGVAGLAWIYQKKIQISKHYLQEHTKTTIEDTVAHEVCHIYVSHYKPFAKQHHGPEFRWFMNLLGLDGKTHHSMHLENGPKRQVRTKTRFIYYTEITKTQILLTSQQHNKMLSGIRYTAKGESLIFSGKLAQIK